jgi:hypothetical protein
MATSYNQQLMVRLFIEEDKLASDEKRDPSMKNVQDRFRVQMIPKLDDDQIIALLHKIYEKLTGRKVPGHRDTILRDICKMVMEIYHYDWDTSCHLVWWCMTQQEKKVTIAELVDYIQKLEKNFKKFEAWTLAYVEEFKKLPLTTQ